MPTWTINNGGSDVSFASLGLAMPKLTYASLAADMLTVQHLTAAWDADPILTYGQTITVKLDGVKVFVGKVRRFPRFAGPDAETTAYEIAGPWDWLERRALLQNQAVVTDPATSTVPTLVPQGFVLLNQADGGTSVSIASSLTTVINAAISAGVAITLGSITGFAYLTGWDQIADLTVADAITRLLATAPDAVVWWNYTTTNPTINIGRRANLTATSLSIAPAGSALASFGGAGYAEFQSIRLCSRPDLVVPGVFVTYRRVNTVNGQNYLALESSFSGTGAATDENALVRTVQLAGSAFSETMLSQECKTLPLAGALTASGTITTGSDFTELSKFWKRKVPALNASDVVIKGFKFCERAAATVADSSGAPTTPTLNTALVNELIEGAITPWMRTSGLARSAQEQNYTARIAYEINGVAQKDASGFGINYSAGVMATNATTRTYTIQESSSFTPQEPTPTGLAAALYTAMSSLQHEGDFTLVQAECTLAVRPGQVVNLTGGRSEWATMAAVVQQVAADLETGQTQITLGWPRQLTADDLTSIYRMNRLKPTASAGLLRATGTL